MNTVQSDIQTEEKIENIIKNISRSFPPILTYLPFFLIIGILYQFINLVMIDRLVYFSWTQVINDTVSLFFPVIFGIVGIMIGSFLNEETIKDFILYFFILLLFSLFLYSYNLDILYNPLLTGFFCIFFGKMIILIQIIFGSKKIKSPIYRNFLKATLLIIAIVLIFSTIKDLNYKNISINKDEKVIYMNDKYIFLENKVISNKENIIYYFSGK